jgi:putative membrane protein
MTQHLMFTLVAPPLLLAGIPTWLWRALLSGRRVAPFARIALHPLVAIFTFNMVLVITHLPHVVDFALEQHWFHFVVHVVLVATAVQMWWPIVTRVPGLPSLTYPYQMAYLFIQSLVPSVIGAFITFSNTAVYSFYETQPRLWGIDPVEDQQMGAFVMKVVGSLILWGFIAVAFFKWFAREESKAGEPAWFEVEDELKQLGISTK